MYNEVSSLSFVIFQLTFIIFWKKKQCIIYMAMSVSVTVILLSSVKLLHGILVKLPKPRKVSYRNDLTAVQS